MHPAAATPPDAGTTTAGHHWLQASGLTAAWRGAPAWRILDGSFAQADGAAFVAILQAWSADPARPRMLHYVGLVGQGPATCMPERLCALLAACTALADQADVLRAQCFGLLPGFHRLVLCEGHVQLTLCIGEPQSLLREQRFIADHILLGDAALCTDRDQAKPLARLCRQGSRLVLRQAADPAVQTALWRPLGFRPLAAVPESVDRAQAPPPSLPSWQVLEYAPAWPLPATRHGWRQAAAGPQDCVVLGAGLAGAAVASALALRGWQVTVLDAAPAPAGGASGLPAGLMAMPLTRDDAPRSRLARAGIRLTRHACRQLLEPGRDWRACGALDLAPAHAGSAASRLPPGWPAEGADWTCLLEDARVPPDARARGAAAAGLWHPHAAWVRPAALVAAWLSRPGIRFVGHCRVASATHDGSGWQLRDAAGRLRASARQLVVCLARDSSELLAHIAAHAPAGGAPVVRLAPLQGVGGSLSGGPMQAGDAQALPDFIVRGAGHFQSGIPGVYADFWWTGATFEPRARHRNPDPAAAQAAHAFNLERLRLLAPDVARHLGGRFAAGAVQAWSGVRCATADRLPAVGPLQETLQPTLWISTAMGARGLAYAALCAELLAAELGGEPLPVEASLARSLWAQRPRLRAATPAAAPGT